MFCEKARAAKGRKSSETLPVVNNEKITIFAGSLAKVDFEGVEVVLLNVKSVSIERPASWCGII